MREEEEEETEEDVLDTEIPEECSIFTTRDSGLLYKSSRVTLQGVEAYWQRLGGCCCCCCC